MLDLLLREQVAVHEVDADLPGQRVRGHAAVTRQHGDGEPQFVQLGDGRLGLRANLVAERDQAGVFTVPLNGGHGMTFGDPGVKLICHRLRQHRITLVYLAYPPRGAEHFRFDAPTGQRSQLLRPAERDPFGLRLAYDCLGQRMLRQALRRSAGRKHLPRVKAHCGIEPCHYRRTLRQRSGFVKGNNPDAAEMVHMSPAFKQHAFAGALRHRR
ncbi:hypothetical protein D3C74_278480 [compost metagenome]